MSQDFFKKLPSEVILNILSRLPTKTTMSCKCVCKPWLDLLVTPEFVKSHIAKSVPGLAVFKPGMQSKPFKIVEFVDELDDPNSHGHPWNIVFNLNLPFHEPLHSSANGLLFLCIQANSSCRERGDHLLCNPITREFIKLPSPQKTYSQPMIHLDTYGFGVSRMSGQYKVVRIFLDQKLPLPPLCQLNRFECQIYTVGTASWRKFPTGNRLTYVDCGGKFLNGNLHFLALELLSNDRISCLDLKTKQLTTSSTTNSHDNDLISCLDLETEHFSTFSTPHSRDPRPLRTTVRHLSVLRDCLCVCDNSFDRMSFDYEIDIWLMKVYGDVKSWTKEFIIRKVYKDVSLGYLNPIKVFKDGNILMELGRTKLLYYSSKTKTIREVDLCGMGSIKIRRTAIFTPSFLPLKAFAMEKVSSF